MKKLRSQTSSEVNAEEISKSIYYIRLSESFNIFHQSINSDTENINYHAFLNELNDFISNEPNKELIKCNIGPMIQKSMEFSTRSAFNPENSEILFQILDKVLQIQIDFNYSSFTNYLFSIITAPQSIEILKSNKKTLENLFSNEFFFSDFVDQQQPSLFFEKTFIEYVCFDMCHLFRHLICEVSPFSLRKKINLTKIISYLFTSIKEEIQIEYSIVLSKLVSVNLNNRLFLNNNQSFFLYSNCIQSASSEIVIECFNDLVFNDPINLNLLTNIILFYQKYQQHQTPIFHWIFKEVISNHTDMLREINKTIPFFGWITLKTSVSDVIDAITNLSKFDASFTPTFISPLFSLLNKGGSSFEEYQFTIQLIENQILLHQISLNDLLKFHFLETFIINLEIDLLSELFGKIYTFSQLAYDVFTLPKSEPLRSEIIDKLIQMAGKYPENAHFISIFLVVSNSMKNISNLMETIIENKNGDLCVSLGDSFVKSDSVVNYFIHENGIEWLDKVYNMKIVNLQQFVFLINSLTKNFYIKEVDKYISSLPENHPIFTICQDDLMMLSYGFDKSHHIYPLKITSFFHLLKFPQTIDPYNAYMIGKHVFGKIMNVEDLPILSEIVNRYVDDATFSKLIEMDSSKFDSFCDPRFDHFPLFQVDEFFANNVFNIKFKAISFWFKFGDTFMKEVKIPFFISDKLQLFMKTDKFLANYEGVEYDAPVDPLKWNNVIIIFSFQKVGHYIEVYVNLNKAVFISSRQLNELPCFEFQTYSTFLFIGPSIRVYQNESMILDVEKIYKNGVSFLGHLNETTIITPFSKEYLKVKKNVLAVKYRGFPVHFLTKANLDLVFNRITNPNLKFIDFIPMISACFKVYSIFHNHLRDFFPWILSIYSTVSHFINIKFLFKTFKFFMKYIKKEEMIDTIICNEQLWSSISNDLIIYSLFESFNNFNFHKEKKKLEYFLSTKLYYKNNNSSLIEYLLVHSSHKFKVIVDKMFVGSYFISEKQEKFIQCNLNTSAQKDNENEVVRDENNVSVQCNLLDKENNYQTSNFDSLCLFQKTNLTTFQKVFINFINNLTMTKENISFIPIDGIYDVFITSDSETKSLLYPILLNYEKVSPNSIQFNSLFLFQTISLFNYKNVWLSTFSLLTENSIDITKQSLLPVVFALLWGLTASSIQSIASTGKANQEENEEIIKMINFLSIESNTKIAANDKNVQKFVASWFPFLLGIKKNHILNSTQNFKLNGFNISAPSPFCFVTMIWNDVINESGSPFSTKIENYSKLQSFIIRSPIFSFYFKFIFSLPDSNFNDVFGAFLSIPLNSGNNELSNCFVQYFTHSLFNVIAENYSYTSKINLIFPFIHFMSISGQINEIFLPIFISDLFLILSVIDTYDEIFFHKLCSNFNLLLLNLFVSILNHCNDENGTNDMIDVLYRVLYRQINFLIKIAAESGDMKNLYLNFFNQTANLCSNQEICHKVIDDFCRSLKIEKGFKSSKIDMKEWNEFIKNDIMPLLKHDKINQVSISCLSEYSKSFTVSFLNSLGKQRQNSENLQQIFKESQKFQESKISWSKMFYNIGQSYSDLTETS